MPFDLVFSYPAWYILLCLALAGIYTFFLYYKGRRKDEKKVSKWVYPMAILRFLSVFILSLLLLNPLLKYLKTTEEKPIVVFVQDNSMSLKGNKDSTFFDKGYQEEIGKFKEDIQSKYEVKTIFIGKEINAQDTSGAFNEKETDIATLFPYIDNSFEGRNLGAVILASDGIYTKGQSPAQKSFKSKTNLYTIALGDTTEYKDQVLKSVKHNEVVFLGDQFPIRIEMNAIKCAGSSATLSIYEGSQKLFSKILKYNDQDQYLEELVYLPAIKPGSKQYRIGLSPIDGERSKVNNYKDVFFDVLDSRKRIKMVYAGPHPDVAAIKRSILSNKNFKFEAEPISAKIDLAKTDLLILHNLPNVAAASKNLLSLAETTRTPILFVVGSESNTSIFRNQKYGCDFVQRAGSSEIQAYVNSGFTDFLVEEDLRTSIESWPPITAPYGTYKVAPDAQVLFKQKIGEINSSSPLLVYTKKETGNIGILFGEGFWKWRVSNFYEKKNFHAFDGLIGKTIQLLSTHKDTRKFKVIKEKEVYLEDESILFQATLLNKNNEAITSQEIELIAKREGGDTYPFYFSKTESGYSLNAGVLPVGNYSYASKTSGGFSFNGKFKVIPLQAELNDLKANHELLNEMASFNNGEMYTMNSLNKLKEKILGNKEIVNTLHTENTLEEIIHKKWIFFLLLLLLSAEWFIRKREGGY